MATQTYTDSVTLTAAAEFNRFDTAAYPVLSGVSGTNTILATGPSNYALSSAMPPMILIPAVTNTAATTLAITPSGGAALTAKSVFYNGVALTGSELKLNVPVVIAYDGTQFNILSPVVGAGTKKVVVTTYDVSTTGSLGITGAGFKPSSYAIYASIDSTSAFSIGMSDGTATGTMYDRNPDGAGTYGNTSSSSYVAALSTGGATQATLAHSSMDSDGITLTKAKSGSPTGTARLMILMFR